MNNKTKKRITTTVDHSKNKEKNRLHVISALYKISIILKSNRRDTCTMYMRTCNSADQPFTVSRYILSTKNN